MNKKELLGKGKSGYSYKIDYQGGIATLKEMHDEKVDYYNFSEPKTQLEETSYHILKKSGIHIPTLLEINHDRKYLVKEYIAGPTITDCILSHQPILPWIKLALEWEQKLANQNLNIDWFPDNFVISHQTLWYVDYEHNPYTETYNFSNWGIWYWLNHEALSLFKTTGDASYINDPKSGLPLKPRDIAEKRSKILR